MVNHEYEENDGYPLQKVYTEILRVFSLWRRIIGFFLYIFPEFSSISRYSLIKKKDMQTYPQF